MSLCVVYKYMTVFHLADIPPKLPNVCFNLLLYLKYIENKSQQGVKFPEHNPGQGGEIWPGYNFYPFIVI